MATKATPMRYFMRRRLSARPRRALRRDASSTRRPAPRACAAGRCSPRWPASRSTARLGRLATRPRGAEDRAAGEPRRARRAMPPLDAPALARDAASRRGAALPPRRACAAAGSPSAPSILDNRQMDGKVGFFVVTPLRSRAGAASCWCSAAGSRATSPTATALPPIDDAGRRRRGRRPRRPAAVAAVRVRRRRQRADPAKSRPRFVRARDRARPAAAVGACSTTRRRRGRRPAARTGRRRPADVQKHYGYAFQWFAIARAHRLPLCLVPTHPSPPAPARLTPLVSFTRSLAAVAARRRRRCAAPRAAAG